MHLEDYTTAYGARVQVILGRVWSSRRAGGISWIRQSNSTCDRLEHQRLPMATAIARPEVLDIDDVVYYVVGNLPFSYRSVCWTFFPRSSVLSPQNPNGTNHIYGLFGLLDPRLRVGIYGAEMHWPCSRTMCVRHRCEACPPQIYKSWPPPKPLILNRSRKQRSSFTTVRMDLPQACQVLA